MKTYALDLFAFLSLAVVGCGGHAAPPASQPPALTTADVSSLPASTKAEIKNDPAYAPCHNTFKPASSDKDVSSDVAAMASACADTTKMKKVGSTLSGELSEKAPPVRFPLGAEAGKCYRVYGISQSTMQDFDVAVIDSTGALVAQDTTDDVSPVVVEDGMFCFKAADISVIRATAGAGTGKFALEVWAK